MCAILAGRSVFYEAGVDPRRCGGKSGKVWQWWIYSSGPFVTGRLVCVFWKLPLTWSGLAVTVFKDYLSTRVERRCEFTALALHAICHRIANICAFFFSLGRSGRGVTIVSGDRPICFLQAGSIRLYLLWISSAFVATTLAVFSNHQLSCQINEPFYWSVPAPPPPLNPWLKQTVMNKGEGCFEKKKLSRKKKKNMAVQ